MLPLTATERNNSPMDAIRTGIFAITSVITATGFVFAATGLLSLEGYAMTVAVVMFSGIVYFFAISEKRHEIPPQVAFRIGLVFFILMQVSLALAAPSWIPEYTSQSYFVALATVALGGIAYWFLEASTLGDHIAHLDDAVAYLVRKTPARITSLFDRRRP